MPVHVTLMGENGRRRDHGEQKACSNGKADHQTLYGFFP
jgi:hypothetical protein